jgi:hypothetical protein
MLCCSPPFRPVLKQFDSKMLERHAGAIYGLFDDNTIAYLNPAWFHFAFDNGGDPDIPERWNLRSSIASAISRALLPFYVTAFSACRRTQAPWEHSYECSSADVFRQFRMKVYPLSPNGELLVVNSLTIERPHDPIERPPHAAVEEHYRGHHGTISQCPHCRRFQHGVERDRWDWVPDWIRHTPQGVSDMFCAICMDYYYPAE